MEQVATVADARPVTPRDQAPPDGLRADIQGLRAVAVLVVLLFHFWPKRLTGGYVGVDVFFVISGFLISSHLLRTPPTSARLLAAFWARRVRRLLPAASLVLLVTFVASLLWMPSTLLASIARETAASAVSLENWVLANAATDYLAADNDPSPEWKKFVAAYKAAFKDGFPSPSLFAHAYYVNTKAALEALDAVKGDLSNNQAALRNATGGSQN